MEWIHVNSRMKEHTQNDGILILIILISIIIINVVIINVISSISSIIIIIIIIGNRAVPGFDSVISLNRASEIIWNYTSLFSLLNARRG